MNQRKQNQKDAQELAIDLKQKEEIDQKVDYYKSILKAYEHLSDAIQKKIDELEPLEDANSLYEKSKLIIEKLESNNIIFEKKKFFEMWMKRSVEYDRKFALITKEYNDNFEALKVEAERLAPTNLRLSQALEMFNKEENLDQKGRNEFYLLLKYEVGRATGKVKFAVEN